MADHDNDYLSMDRDGGAPELPSPYDDDLSDKISVDSDVPGPEAHSHRRDRDPERMTKRYKALASHFANFSIQYNFNSITLALVFVSKSGGPADPPYYGVTTAQGSLLKSLVFVGAVLGQLTMGWAGDCMGLGAAMIFTNALVVIGALTSALASVGDEQTFVTVCMVARLIIGVGIGGNYPLAATMSSKAAAEAGEKTKAKAGFKVASSFFWQMPGILAVYTLGLIFTLIFGADAVGMEYRTQTAIAFRTILAVGAIPSAVVVALLVRIRCTERKVAALRNPVMGGEAGGTRRPSRSGSGTITTTTTTTTTDAAASGGGAAGKPKAGQNLCKIILQNPAFFSYLVATGGCWFLYDIVYYGSILNTPTILDGVFGQNNTVQATCWQSLVVDLASVPGVIAGIFSLKAITAKQLQSWGFFSMAVVFLLMGMVFLPTVDIEHDDAGRWFAFCLLVLMLLVLNFGAGLSTYVLPTTTYPPHIRSTFFGFSAACGKIGAVVGSAMFKPIFSCCGVEGEPDSNSSSLLSFASTAAPAETVTGTYGPTITFCICCVVCLTAIVLTHFFIDPRRDSTFCESSQEKLKPDGLGSLNS